MTDKEKIIIDGVDVSGCKSFLEWLLKQQYYILPANIKKKNKRGLK